MHRLLLIRSFLILGVAPLVGLAMAINWSFVNPPWPAAGFPFVATFVFGPLLASDRVSQVGGVLKKAGQALDPGPGPEDKP